MMSYIELIKPEVLFGSGVLILGCVALGVYAIYVDNKREKQKHRHHH